MLQVNNLEKTYKLDKGHENRVLKNLNLEFKLGEFVTILGESGSGKSTLLNILGGLDKDFEGNYIIEGKDYKEVEWSNFKKQRVGFIFQNFNLIAHLTALENVELALSINGIEKEQRRNMAIDILTKVGLQDQINKKPGYMSGGEQQRVAIARALVNNPDIILADEPTGQLDTDTAKEILDLLKELGKDKLVIMVTHMEEFARDYSTRIIEIEDGKIINNEHLVEEISVVQKKEKELPKTISKKDIILQGLKNTFAFKRLSTLLLLVMTLGMSSFILITGIGFGIRNNMDSILNFSHETSLFYITGISEDGLTLLSEMEEQISTVDNVKGIYNSTGLTPVLDFNENIEIKDQLFYYSNEPLKYDVITLTEDSYFNKNLLIGKYPTCKNEILIGRSTAKNLVYEYYKKNELDKDNVVSFSDKKILSIIKTIDISFFTEHKNDGENRYSIDRYFLQKFNSKIQISGIVNDDKMTAQSNYPSDIGGYVPRIFILDSLFSEVINQMNDRPLDTNIIDYYRSGIVLIEVKSGNDYEERRNTIKEILALNDDYRYEDRDGIDSLYVIASKFSLFLIGVGMLYGTIIFLITFLIIGALISRNMKKRKLEFGVLFTLGYQKKEIEKILFFEGVSLSIIGLIFSYLLAFIIKLYINDTINETVFFLLDEEVFDIINIISFKWYIVLLVLVLIVYAFIRPIRKLSRLNIIDVLREE